MNNISFVAIAFLAVLVIFSGCDDPGSVGSSFGPPNPKIKTDTIPLTSITLKNAPYYSGLRTFVNTGNYNDALFGRFEATALLTPDLPGISDTISDNAQLSLRLRIGGVTGDTLIPADFRLYEIERRWRQTEWRLDSIPPVSAIHTLEFDYSFGDSIEVILPASVRDRYIQYHRNTTARDSTYRTDFFGFAISGTSDSKMLILNTQTSRLIISNFGEGRDLNTGMRQSGTSLIHTPPTSIPPGTIIADGNFKNLVLLEFEISSEMINSFNLSKVELVLYEDTLSMKSSLPLNQDRFKRNNVFLYQLENSELEFAITKAPSFSMTRNSKDASYRLDILSTVYNVLNGAELTAKFYISTEPNSGVIRNLLFYNQDDPNWFPKILVTKIITE